MNTTTPRGSGFRGTAFVALAGICVAVVALLANGGRAWGQGGLAFGISPADESLGAYFSYTLAPGASKTDTARVTNSGSAALVLRAYAADGISASGGGTAFGAFGERRTGVGAWVAVTQPQLNIAPGTATSVSVTISVPPGAAPGDYVAGIVVEAPPKAGTVGGNVNANITERAGVAIVVRVPGPTSEKLALGNFCFNQETGSRYFELPVQNQGSVISAATGTFNLETDAGMHVFERPVELGSLIPTLDTVIRIHSPQDPPPGKYVARIVLKQKDGQEVERESSLTIPDRKVNGCKTEATSKTTGDSLSSTDNFAVQATQDQQAGTGSSPLLFLALSTVILVTCAVAFTLWHNRKRRARSAS